MEPATEPRAAPRAALLLMGSSQWHPGQRIEVVRPPVSASFLAIGCGFCGGAVALAVFLFQQASTEPLPALSRTLGVLGLGTLGATATIVYLGCNRPSGPQKPLVFGISALSGACKSGFAESPMTELSAYVSTKEITLCQEPALFRGFREHSLRPNFVTAHIALPFSRRIVGYTRLPARALAAPTDDHRLD